VLVGPVRGSARNNVHLPSWSAVRSVRGALPSSNIPGVPRATSPASCNPVTYTRHGVPIEFGSGERSGHAKGSALLVLLNNNVVGTDCPSIRLLGDSNAHAQSCINHVMARMTNGT
jgi:hypothetical protein